MEKKLLYKIHLNDHISYTEIEQPFDQSERYYRLTASKNCYLKNKQTNTIFKTILVPEYQLPQWIEENYK